MFPRTDIPIKTTIDMLPRTGKTKTHTRHQSDAIIPKTSR